MISWLLILLVITSIFGQEELPLAQPCVESQCLPPHCRCASTTIPGGLPSNDVPQFVLLTFDDGINALNALTYREHIYSRTNKNGCPIKASFFTIHEYTDYSVVNELYNNGYEIGLHSITHSTPQSYWLDLDYEGVKKEFADQKVQLAHFANIPPEDIHGMRVPYLQMLGNHSFQMMKEIGMTYDLSWGTWNHTNPGLWPYTLDFASFQECGVPPCPNASIPGIWVLPVIDWLDVAGFPCSMVDACVEVPDLEDSDAWLEFFVSNFERHYNGNRAPFGFHAHEWHIASYPAVMNAFGRFLDKLNGIEDVYMVNPIDVINWTKNPKNLTEYNKEQGDSCHLERELRSCQKKTCGPLYAEHSGMDIYMTQCTSCPTVYPWLGNPLGTAPDKTDNK